MIIEYTYDEFIGLVRKYKFNVIDFIELCEMIKGVFAFCDISLVAMGACLSDTLISRPLRDINIWTTTNNREAVIKYMTEYTSFKRIIHDNTPLMYFKRRDDHRYIQLKCISDSINIMFNEGVFFTKDQIAFLPNEKMFYVSDTALKDLKFLHLRIVQSTGKKHTQILQYKVNELLSSNDRWKCYTEQKEIEDLFIMIMGEQIKECSCGLNHELWEPARPKEKQTSIII